MNDQAPVSSHHGQEHKNDSNSIHDFSTSSSPLSPRDVHTLTYGDLERLMAELGEPRFRVDQLWDWIWDKHVSSFDEMTNLPGRLRSSLSARLAFPPVRELARSVSEDGSRKYLLSFADGVSVECVGMPGAHHLTACVSTQAGCAMRCAFCATGASGLSRSLKSFEIYEQVMHVRDDFAMRVSSVVLMGQGEPFANYDETLKALRRLNAPQGAAIGARHLTVSTCGVIPYILRFAKEPEQFTLAVSLHSAVQKTRDLLMPGVKRWSLLRLYDAMGTYVNLTGRRPTYEYALIRGVNDTEDELSALCDFCRDSLSHVNLIRLNEIPGSPFQPSGDARAGEFVRRLKKAGVEATIRNSRGGDIDAACGQLRQRMHTTK